MCTRRRTTLYGILWDSMGIDGKSTSLSGTKRDFSAKNRRKPVRLWFYCAISLQKLENRGFFQQNCANRHLSLKWARRSVSRVLCSPLKVAVTIHLGCLLPDTSCNLPEQRSGNRSYVAPIWSCSRRGLPCHCRYRQRGALLPHPFTLTAKAAVCFLWHFPWSRLRRTLSGAVFPWSPDFPPLRTRAITQPSGPYVNYAATRKASSLMSANSQTA